MCLLTIILASIHYFSDDNFSWETESIISFMLFRLPWAVALIVTFALYGRSFRKVALLPLTFFIAFPEALLVIWLSLTWGISGFAP